MDQGDLVTRLRALADDCKRAQQTSFAEGPDYEVTEEALREAANALETATIQRRVANLNNEGNLARAEKAEAEAEALKVKLTEQKERIMRKEFQVHVLNETAIDKANQMAVRFSELADWLDTVCEKSPELTIADRKLEEACFYAKRAMAQQRENQA